MNLTLIKELSLIYEAASNLDQAALSNATNKIKFPSSKGNKNEQRKHPNSRANSKNLNSQLASASWNLLISINKYPPTNFSTLPLVDKTGKVALACAKIISTAELKIGELDLDKLLANIVLKLVEALKLTSENGLDDIVNLMSFCFQRLQNHYNCIESGVRRLSLVELPQIGDPLADVNFLGLSPDSTKDPILIQIATVQLECLLKMALILETGSVNNIFEALRPFHEHLLKSNPEKYHISQLFSSISRLQAWSQSEWSFWEYACNHKEYLPHLEYFRRRCSLKLGAPLESTKLNSTIIASVLMTNQLQDQMLSFAQEIEIEDDSILGACLAPLSNERNLIFIPKISSIISRAPSKPVSANGLKFLLQYLDHLRSSLFFLARFDEFLSFCTVLNDCLIRIHFPYKFYVSWTTCLLKSVVDNKKVVNASKMRSLLDALISGLLINFDILADDIRGKVCKIVEQCLGLAGNIYSVEKYIADFKGSLNSILEFSVFNLSPDFFKELSRITFERAITDPSVLTYWVKVLAVQVGVQPEVFATNNVSSLHRLVGIVESLIFDQIKKDNFVNIIYQKLLQLGCSQEMISLNKILMALKSSKSEIVIQPSSNFNADINIVLNILMRFKQTLIWPSDLCLDDFAPKLYNNLVELEIYKQLINSACVNAPEECFWHISNRLRGLSPDIDRFVLMLTNVEMYDFGAEMSPMIKEIHSKYLSGDEKEALKLGYSKLKHFLNSTASGLENVFETIELILYLHRLSVTTRNLSEAKYFVKQLRQLAESSNSVNLKGFADKVQEGLSKLTGSDKRSADLIECELILKSPQYKLFDFEYQSLLELNQMRERIKSFYPGPRNQFSVSCNGIRINQPSSISVDLLKAIEIARNGLKSAQDRSLYYCVKEWAKVAIFIQYHLSLFQNSDLELIELFELSRTSEKLSVALDKLSGSLGMLFDEFMSAFWIFMVSDLGLLTVFLVRINSQSYLSKLQRFHDICSQNTDTLRNTDLVSQSSEKKAQWWKIRKNLDSELSSLCSDLDDELFALLPKFNFSTNPKEMIVKNLSMHADEFLRSSFNNQVYFDNSFISSISALGTCPPRIKLEGLMKMISYSLAFSTQFTSLDPDIMIPKLRKSFESAYDDGFPNVTDENQKTRPMKLILDKNMNLIPFECFSSLKDQFFRRVPLLKAKKEGSSGVEPYKKVFYVVNPSGDLSKTQERFEDVFKNQPNWKGVIGRAPTSDEFLYGICGLYDLFIYFGHSSGESYTSLKDLKSRISDKGASSALLIGCSSGKIKCNGIFPPESPIFHYLENESPLILANLWDVTDKDIDMYIKGVLEDADLLVPAPNKLFPLQPTATPKSIIENAHNGRQRCFLKALNGYAPIVYGII